VLVLALVLVPVVARAQAPGAADTPPQWQGRPIERIQFHGALWGTYPGSRNTRPTVQS